MVKSFDSRQAVIVPTYIPLLSTVRILPEFQHQAEAIRIISQRSENRKRYEAVSAVSGVPADFIAALHYMECNGDFSRHLANGDPIDRPTVNVPAGIPAGTWEDCAIAALAIKGWTLDKNLDWSDKLLWLWRAESWNGWGYRLYHPETPSQYLWSGTTIAKPGKYTADGNWDKEAVSMQVGCVAIWMELGILNVSPPHPVKLQQIYDRPPSDVDRANISPTSEIMTPPTEEALRTGFLADAAKFYESLPHQLNAWIWLQSQLTATQLKDFRSRYTPDVDRTSQQQPLEAKTTERKYQLKFVMRCTDSDEFAVGRLDFLLDGKSYNAMQVSSSTPGNQWRGSWTHKGGLIPPSSVVRKYCNTNYEVKTTPIYMPNVAGVSGNFYPIAPFDIPTERRRRGDFGIHRDANVVGSLGCPVAVTRAGWEAIQREFAKLAGMGIRSIELIVEYT